MRKEFGKILRDSFSRRMKSTIPDFKEEKVKSIYIGPGERAFCKKLDDSLWCWIVLSPSPKDYDEFTLMVGWSTYGRYPELSVIPSFIQPTPDHAEFSEPEYLIRLPQLWSGGDFWWVIKPFKVAQTIEQLKASMASISKQEAELLVLPQVDLAFDKLIESGLPYLQSFILHSQQQVD